METYEYLDIPTYLEIDPDFHTEVTGGLKYQTQLLLSRRQLYICMYYKTILEADAPSDWRCFKTLFGLYASIGL